MIDIYDIFSTSTNLVIKIVSAHNIRRGDAVEYVQLIS